VKKHVVRQTERFADERQMNQNKLAEAAVIGHVSHQLGRAIVSRREHHIFLDSPPPLGGPNEELNPLDFLMAALATCGTFVIETAAREMDLSLESVHLEAEGDFDLLGVRGVEGIDSSITEFRVKVNIQGPTKEQSSLLVEQFKAHCSVYNFSGERALIWKSCKKLNTYFSKGVENETLMLS
jgi:uncharacterized OsmC-like protein